MSFLHGPRGSSGCLRVVVSFHDSVPAGAAQGLSDVHAPGYGLAEGGERGMWSRRAGSLAFLRGED